MDGVSLPRTFRDPKFDTIDIVWNSSWYCFICRFTYVLTYNNRGKKMFLCPSIEIMENASYISIVDVGSSFMDLNIMLLQLVFVNLGLI